MTVDCVTFNGEYDLLELRLEILGDYVDQFILVEAPTTFSGLPKPLYWAIRDVERFKRWESRITYFVVDEAYTTEEIVFADRSPNTIGAEHWAHEFLQKESIKKALTHLNDHDICFIGDVDEIWDPQAEIDCSEPTKLKLRVYTYYLDNCSTEEFWGTVVAEYKDIKDECLNHIRTNARKTEEMYGWHFTSMGGYNEVRRKLSDSYTRDSYWTEAVENSLESNLIHKVDFLGRNFTYWESQEDWPVFLREHKEKYQHLCYNL